MRKPIVGVVGPGDEAGDKDIDFAEELGRCIAQAGWITLSGGRNVGVMDAVNRGACAGGGLTVGILPTTEKEKTSQYVDIAIVTDMGSSRNNINALTSDVVIACGMGAGTASEISLALKAHKNVILLGAPESARKFFGELGGKLVSFADTPEGAIFLAGTVIEGLSVENQF
jgi:hypothetical protein